MRQVILVRGKIDRWKTLFDGMPGYKCDVRTLIVKIDKSQGTVEVEQQFWFKHVHTRIYLSDHAMKRARRLYKSLDLGQWKVDWGKREIGDRFIFWVNAKVYK